MKVYVGMQFDDYYAGIGGYVPRKVFESINVCLKWVSEKEHDRIYYPIEMGRSDGNEESTSIT